MPKPKIKKPIIEIVNKLTEKRKIKPNFEKYNKVNLKTISTKNQLINIHFKKIGTPSYFSPEDRQKLKYLIELARDPQSFFKDKSKNVTNENLIIKKLSKKKEPQLDIQALKIRKKKFLEKLKALTTLEKLKADPIFKKIKQKEAIINILKKKRKEINQEIERLNKYNTQYFWSKETIQNKIDALVSKKELLNLPFNELRELILKEAENLQLRVVNITGKNLIIQPTQITRIIRNTRSLSKDNLDLVSRTLNTVHINLITNIRKRLNTLFSERDAIQKRFLTIDNINLENKLTSVNKQIRSIKEMYPNINQTNKIELQTEIKNLEQQIEISPDRKSSNPLKSEIKSSELDKYSITKENAIVLSKVEKELNALVEKYF